MVMAHQSVEHYSEQFAKKLRRHNFTTPKNYLDFISTYLRLLERKNKENLALVCSSSFNDELFISFSLLATTSGRWLGEDRRSSDRIERTRFSSSRAAEGSVETFRRMSETLGGDLGEDGLSQRDGSGSNG